MSDQPETSKLSIQFEQRVPEDDNRTRAVCNHCGFVHYQNPKIVAGVVATWNHEILLCKRAIEPAYGLWTLPAGYLELEETPEEGALREAREEAGANIELDQLLAIYTIRRISQVQIFYRGRLLDPTLDAGTESLEVGLFAWPEIPWSEIAFPSVRWALEHFHSVRDQKTFTPFKNP
jgi:ADP-ribose pyrophosphatase YjhB (NUDIX family)